MSSSPVIYMIRHGEKPDKVDGEDPPGLSALGIKRSEALVKVFDTESRYNIGLIVAQKPKKHGKEGRPSETVQPLVDDLGPSVQHNFDIDTNDAGAVASLVLNYTGKGNILICWEHGNLTDIAKAIGVEKKAKYPDDRYDVIWTVEAPYHEISSCTSEHVPGLDDQFVNDP